MSTQAPASPAALVAARAFLVEPTEALEQALLTALRTDLAAAGFVAPRDAFIEWGCVEHGIVHVGYAEGQAWIELDPAVTAPIWSAL